jgi:hypothetical protein
MSSMILFIVKLLIHAKHNPCRYYLNSFTVAIYSIKVRILDMILVCIVAWNTGFPNPLPISKNDES